MTNRLRCDFEDTVKNRKGLTRRSSLLPGGSCRDKHRQAPNEAFSREIIMIKFILSLIYNDHLRPL